MLYPKKSITHGTQAVNPETCLLTHESQAASHDTHTISQVIHATTHDTDPVTLEVTNCIMKNASL